MTLKKNLFLLVILFILIIFAWHKIIFQSFLGESYMYFLMETGEIFRFDSGGLFLISFLTPLFKDNFMLYQYLCLFTAATLGVMFYWVVYELTDKKFIAFASVLFFSINYGSNFEMLANGDYGVFLQRVLFFVMLFPSFAFFIKFIKTKKELYFLFSLLLYSLAILFARFNLFFLPFYFTYIAGVFIFKKYSLREFLSLSLHSLLFVVIALIIMYYSRFTTAAYLNNINIFSYVSNNTRFILYNDARQLTLLTIPDNLLKQILLNIDISLIDRLNYFFIPVVSIYLIVLLYVLKFEKSLRPVIIASALFSPIIFTLNMFMRGEEVQYVGYGSRYFFVPAISFAIFWAIFLYSLKKNKYLKPFVLAFLFFWVVIQINLINQAIDKDFYKHIAVKKSLEEVKKFAKTMQPGSYLVVPAPMGNWSAYFAQKFYAPKGVLIIGRPEKLIKWDEKSFGQFNPKKDIILNYSYQTEEISNATRDYKNLLVE